MLFQLVKYWPEKGQSGFLVWRYLFKRDDPAPAPWTKAGKKRSGELGLVMQYPDGYEEKQKENEEKGSGKRKNSGLRFYSMLTKSPIRWAAEDSALQILANRKESVCPWCESVMI